MLKSLFSGVSGLQSHQIAMDVESNNIANVNTIGFKYSRANFSDLLAQTNQIATAPQDSLGGKNAVQIGLGTSVASITRIHTQGSIQNTDKNTDVAIQGDGYYIVSSDGGNTYKYTRSGDFKFDANGNFVDNNGFITQGWLRDETTGLVDSSGPIENITIPPGLTTPASATTVIDLKANLNSSNLVSQFAPTFALDATGVPVDAAGNALSPVPDPENIGVMFNDLGEGFSLQDGQGVWMSYRQSSYDAGGGNSLAAGITPGVSALDIDINGQQIQIAAPNLQTYQDVINAINNYTSITGVRASLDTLDGSLVLTNDNDIGTTAASKNIDLVINGGNTVANIVAGGDISAFQYTYLEAGGVPQVPVAPFDTTARTFTSIEDLRDAIDIDANWLEDSNFNVALYPPAGTDISVTVNSAGEFVVQNNSTTLTNMRMNVTSLTDGGVVENTRFTQNLSPLSRSVRENGGFTQTQPFNHATHSTSIDVFDSLGSKHTVKVDFRKVDNQRWHYSITVPNPAELDNGTNSLTDPNQLITFDTDGSLTTSDITFQFTGNNGSAPNQQITIDLGTIGAFDGLTSFASPSATSGISQDGYPGGDLLGIRIDQSGTLVGSFSNGRSFGLAQLSMAKFVNNEGLAADGGNIYLQSANSGDPIVGTAATGGRGFIQSAALEASNVDLSRSLTQLIIIQRGYQANGKTITTSDQLLETLIGLKR